MIELLTILCVNGKRFYFWDDFEVPFSMIEGKYVNRTIIICENKT